MKTFKTATARLIFGALLLGGALTVRADSGNDQFLRDIFDGGVRYSQAVEFDGRAVNSNVGCEPNCPLPAPDATTGRQNFGLSTDGNSIDNTLALFQGQSQMIGTGTIVSNGRACSTCHRPDLRSAQGVITDAVRLGLPHTFPLSSVIPASDTLFTGRAADDSNHPSGLTNLDTHALVLIRPGRFNNILALNDPFRQVIQWRKVPRFVNTGVTIGLLNDMRAREIFEVVRGAVFSHNQNLDNRFDDLLRVPNPRSPAGPPTFEDRIRNIGAFIESTTIDPPALKAFLMPTDATANPQCSYASGAACKPEDCRRTVGSWQCDLATVLKNDPYFSVPITTTQQRRGQQVFHQQCFSCHNTPNVFGNIDHVPGLPLSFAPRIGHSFDIGVAQRNKFALDFRAFLCADGTTMCAETSRQLTRVVLPLVKVDGTAVQQAITVDPGTASSTGRYEDLYRFRVPQLRRVSQLAPYFHDNSAATLEEVLDYLTSESYRSSADGSRSPICLDAGQRADLLAFLRIL